MPRNKSEKVTPKQRLMLAYLEALRHLVKVNLAAGADHNFAKCGTHTATLRDAALRYRKAQNEWNGDHIIGGIHPTWPILLSGVEAYVKEQLGAHHGLTEASTPGITA